MTLAKVRLAMAAMGQPKTKVADLCRELGGNPPDALPTCQSGGLSA
jgi:hypothetical protein